MTSDGFGTLTAGVMPLGAFVLGPNGLEPVMTRDDMVSALRDGPQTIEGEVVEDGNEGTETASDSDEIIIGDIPRRPKH